MAEVFDGNARNAEGLQPRRSWLAPALGVSFAAHAGLAALLWVETLPQPQAGAVVSIEIVSVAGAASAPAANSGASPSRAAATVARPERAPPPKAITAPDAPRAAREPAQAARLQREALAVSTPDRAAPASSNTTALRAPVPPETVRLPAAAEALKPVPPETVASRPAELALRRPARIPPPPAMTPRLAAAPSTAKRSSETGRAPPQTASVPVVAADAAPGAAAPSAGPETGTTPPRYGFGSAANPIPRYPETARENGWEGVVMLSVSVGAGGEALSVSILKSSGHGLLDASAVDAVRRWRFAPARRAGVPIPGTATVPIRFRLEE